MDTLIVTIAGIMLGVPLGGVLATLLVPQPIMLDARQAARRTIDEIKASEIADQVRTLVNDVRAKKASTIWKLVGFSLLFVLCAPIPLHLGYVTGLFLGQLLVDHFPWVVCIVFLAAMAKLIIAPEKARALLSAVQGKRAKKGGDQR